MQALANVAYIDGMATLNIRNLPDDVHRRLRARRRARAQHGGGGAGRAILTQACCTGPRASAGEAVAKAKRLQAFVDELYGGKRPNNVVDDLIAERRR